MARRPTAHLHVRPTVLRSDGRRVDGCAARGIRRGGRDAAAADRAVGSHVRGEKEATRHLRRREWTKKAATGAAAALFVIVTLA
eukprot:scaffold30041_cov107-Isochrysis_galbana.AAC.2